MFYDAHTYRGNPLCCIVLGIFHYLRRRSNIHGTDIQVYILKRNVNIAKFFEFWVQQSEIFMWVLKLADY